MKKLFTVNGKYFENKMVAKEYRNSLNKENVEKYHVSRGPDHMGVHGHRVARMRLQPKS